eukprot:superscaffoldBa00001241_g9687
MCAMQQAFAHRREGDSDAVSNSTDTSCWSTPSRLCCGSNTPHYSSDFEDQTDSLTHKTPEAKTSDKSKKAQGDHKQKTNNTANHQLLKLPPIKLLQVSSPRSQSADLNCIRELKSQVWDLQHQLSEARTENKLLKRLQHRHMVALQHFQDSESSIAQILTKHSNEARVLQGLLRETRTCRDNLARQLQATGNKLLNAKASLQHLQLLSQDHSLLEREELTLRLAKATAELEEKDKRILESFATEYPETEVSVNVTSEKETGRPGTGRLDHLEETETERCADTVEQNGCSGENPELQIERDGTEEEEAVDAPQELEEEHTEEHEGQVSTILEESLSTTEPKCKGYKLPKTKRNYSFKQTIENLHSGRPAYSSVDTTQDRMRVNGRDPQQWDL